MGGSARPTRIKTTTRRILWVTPVCRHIWHTWTIPGPRIGASANEGVDDIAFVGGVVFEVLDRLR